MICREAGYEKLLDKIAAAQNLFIGAPTMAEAELVLTIKLERDAGAVVEQFLAESGVTVLPFSREHVSIFLEAFLRYGQGRHAARLNMGDCFSYATAKVAGQPLLFAGDDFTRTDLPAT